MSDGWTYEAKIAQLDKLAKWEQAVSALFEQAGLGPVRIIEVQWGRVDSDGERENDVAARPDAVPDRD